MLGKLIKNDFKATWKTFLMLDVALLALALINKGMLVDVVSGISMFTFIVMLIASLFITTVLIVMKFYKTMLSDQGYLSFTLPVTPMQHLISKVLVAAFWLIVNGLVVFISLLLFMWDVDVINNIWRTLTGALGEGELKTLLVTIGINLIISAFSTPILFFCAMSIGQLFRTHKIIGSVAGYFIISMVSDVLDTVAMLVVGSGYSSVAIETMEDLQKVAPYLTKIYVGSAFTMIILAALCFAVSNILLSRKLNLD